MAPDPLPEDAPRNPRFAERYACDPDAELPRTASLEQTLARILPYWHCVVFPSLMRYDSLLVVAHGNSLRALVKHLDNMSVEAIVMLNIPTGRPLVYEFDDETKPIRHYYLGNADEIAAALAAVAAQGKAKK